MKYEPYHGDALSYAIPGVHTESMPTCPLGFAIPPQELWMGYGKTAEEHLSSGEVDISTMLQLLNDSGYGVDRLHRILDWGCGAGRMIRWLKNIATTGEVWGADISSAHIFWCKRYLSPPFNFFTTTTIPHLPFEDRYFDFIYARSVFTHVDDLAEAWLLELRRILQPDDDGLHNQPRIAVGLVHTIIVFGHQGVCAVGNTVLEMHGLLPLRIQ